MGGIRCIDSQLLRVRGQRRIPIIDVSNSTDRQHDSNVFGFEIIHDVRGHPDWDALRCRAVIGKI